MPASDTQESPNVPAKSKMATLQPDIMFEIADILHRAEFPKESPVISRLSLINKHWGTHMKLHPLFSAAHFELTRTVLNASKEASVEDIEEWLMHPNRRHRLIRSFSLTIDCFTDYHDLCDLLDNQLSDVRFDIFRLVALEFFRGETNGEEEVHFPQSLKARHLTIGNQSSEKPFNWKSLNLSLRDNLTSLTISDRMFDPHNRDIVFKSLKKLHFYSDKGSDTHRLNDFLRKHSSINYLWTYGAYSSSHQVPLKIDSLDNLETLTMYNTPVDLSSGNVQAVPLKSLTYSGCRYPTKDWTILSSTLETLVIDAEDGCCEWEQNLLNPKMLCKLNNIKRFRLEGTNWIPKFSEAFNSSLYDNAMPLIEDFELSDSTVSKEALHRFVDKHKRLCRIDVQCYKKRYTGNPREVCV